MSKIIPWTGILDRTEGRKWTEPQHPPRCASWLWRCEQLPHAWATTPAPLPHPPPPQPPTPAWCTDCTPFKLWCSEELFPLVFLSCVFGLFVCFYKNKKVIEEQFFSLRLSSFLISTKTNYRPYQIPSSLLSSPLLNTHAHPQTHTFVQRILDRKRRNWFSPRITGTQNPSNNRRAMFTIIVHGCVL